MEVCELDKLETELLDKVGMFECKIEVKFWYLGWNFHLNQREVFERYFV